MKAAIVSTGLSRLAAVVTPAAAQHPRVEMQTTLGRFVVELYPEQAPNTVANFLQYVQKDFYAGTLFHPKGSSYKAHACCPRTRAQETAMVKLHTNLGTIALDLDAEKAPVTVENFLAYVNGGFYTNTIFHRVIDGFMIQGGGFERGMKQKPVRTPIKNEAANGLQNTAYTVAMARTPDPDSATSQFFINVADNDFLDYRAPTPKEFGYCVFGRVVEGKEVVDQIKKVATATRGMHRDVPVEDVVITKAEVM